MKTSAASPAHEYGLALFRTSLGVMWIAHALLKLFEFRLPGTARYFESVGLVGALAYPVFAVELVGGVALILGVYGRQVALALIPIMATAAWAHFPNGWPHTGPNGGWEYPAFLIVASVAVWLLGDGALALRRSTWMSPDGLGRAG